jgi:hypothetical protein
VLYKAYPSVKLDRKTAADEEDEEGEGKNTMKRGFGKT